MRVVRLLMLWAGSALAVALLILVAIHSNGSIETDAWIDRPPEDVWKVLTATSSYGSWNPMICRSWASRKGKLTVPIESRYRRCGNAANLAANSAISKQRGE